MEDIDTPAEATIDFVPALCFVPRGVAKERPEKITLTQDELTRIINDAKEQLDSDADEDDSADDDNDAEMDVDAQQAAGSSNNAAQRINDEFNFENYQNESAGQGASIATVVDANEQYPDEEDDSEAEDEIIKPSDNLLLVGHVQDDAASMEVWVFNEQEEALYTHHDFLLDSFPLCIEWLSYDPGSDNKTGNICAIGSMDAIITVWDLDIQDSLEPTFKLGSKGSRKKNKPRVGHKKAVLDLSWNRQFEHILASASVDETVILWDLDQAEPHTSISGFAEKVQTLEFHAEEAHTLLTGCADGHVRLYDCRDAEGINASYESWQVPGEVEKVLWNPNEQHYFVIASNDGTLHYADKRNAGALLWSHKAHEEEVSGVCFNLQLANMLCSTSTDGALKVWKFNSSALQPIYSHDFNMGRLQCMKQCPEDPFTLAFGGEKAPRCRVFNIKNFEAVRRCFDIPDAQQ